MGMVQEGTLTRFESSEHRHVNAGAPKQQLSARGDLRLQVRELQFPRETGPYHGRRMAASGPAEEHSPTGSAFVIHFLADWKSVPP